MSEEIKAMTQVEAIKVTKPVTKRKSVQKK